MSWLYSDNLSTPSLLSHYATNTRLACAKVLVRFYHVDILCSADLRVCMRVRVNGGPVPTYSANIFPWVVTVRKKRLQKQSTVH